MSFRAHVYVLQLHSVVLLIHALWDKSNESSLYVYRVPKQYRVHPRSVPFKTEL